MGVASQFGIDHIPDLRSPSQLPHRKREEASPWSHPEARRTVETRGLYEATARAGVALSQRERAWWFPVGHLGRRDRVTSMRETDR